MRYCFQERKLPPLDFSSSAAAAAWKRRSLLEEVDANNNFD
jgi:hypothetical protein